MGARRPTVTWSPRGQEAGPGARWLRVIGCPRSGTRSLARLLQNAGVRVGHERVGLHGTVSSYFAVDDSFYHGPHQKTGDRLSRFTFSDNWLLVRNPIEIVGSMTFGVMMDSWWDWQKRHTGIDRRKDGDLLASCRFVLDWIPRCARQTSFTLRIEDWREKWTDVAERLRIEVEPLPDFSHANALHPKPRLTWDQMKSEDASLYDGLRLLADRYGYEENTE